MSNQYLIPRPGPCPSVINTYEYQYPPGNVNYTDRRVVTKNICIDSMFRTNYDRTNATDFTYLMQDPINNVISMKVSALEFPNSHFTFSSYDKSNQFTITIYNAPTPIDMSGIAVYDPVITHVIEIPEGNYQSDLFTNSINNMFSNLRYGLEYIYFEVSEINTHCIFRTKSLGDDIKDRFLNVDLPYDFYFTIDFTVPSNDNNRPLYRNAGWMMGFRQAYYEAHFSPDPTINLISSQFEIKDYNWYIQSESSYGSSVYNYVYLDIDDFNKNFSTNTIYGNTTKDTYLGNTVIARIPVSSCINTIVTNNASDCIAKKREYFGPVKIERLHIRLLNRFGESITLNGNDYSFILEIEQLYS